MTRWFRFYDDAVNDPKVQRLSGETFKAWVNLLCCASRNSGKLPTGADLAFVLRMKPPQVAVLLTELHAAGLLDKVDGGFAPHNWEGRQYQSDSSAERMRRHRDRKRSAAGDVTRDVTSDARCDVTVTVQNRTETETEDRIVEARASASVYTAGSKALTAALWKALGILSPLHVPPDLAGTDYRAVDWERAGWTEDLIFSEARRVGPGKPLSYYEKVFATAFAKRQAPLPVVEVKQPEKITVAHGTSQNRSGSLIAAIDRQLAALEAEDGRDFALSEAPVLRLSR